MRGPRCASLFPTAPVTGGVFSAGREVTCARGATALNAGISSRFPRTFSRETHGRSLVCSGAQMSHVQYAAWAISRMFCSGEPVDMGVTPPWTLVPSLHLSLRRRTDLCPLSIPPPSLFRRASGVTLVPRILLARNCRPPVLPTVSFRARQPSVSP